MDTREDQLTDSEDDEDYEVEAIVNHEIVEVSVIDTITTCILSLK